MRQGILPDAMIADAVARRDIEIDPFDPEMINPSSYDVTLGEKVRVYAAWVGDPTGPDYVVDNRDGSHLYRREAATPHDVRTEPRTLSYAIHPDVGWVLKPGILYLMHTRERVATSRFVPVLDGKSSIGRLGIVIHKTAGFGDPGFDGQWTLEVEVVNPVRVFAGMRFAQMRFHTLAGEVSRPYAGKYAGRSSGPVPSAAHRQFGKP